MVFINNVENITSDRMKTRQNIEKISYSGIQ